MADELQGTARPRKMWRIVLVISLALNLIIVGLVVGVVVSGRFRDGPPRGFDMGIGVIGRALDHEDRRAIGDALRHNPQISRPSRADGMRTMTAMLDALRTDPFDPDAVARVVAMQQQRASDTQAAVQDVLVQRIAAMSAEQRAAFADRLAREIAQGGNDRR